jgi:hypothetical protein
MAVAVNATANPSGTVEAAAYETLAGAIVEAVRAGCDAVLLDLHGAMVAQGIDDGEGELLRRIRAVAPRCRWRWRSTCTATSRRRWSRPPTSSSASRPTRTSTCSRPARTPRACCSPGSTADAKPHVAWAQPPLLSHTLRSATGEGAMQRAVQRARQLEAEGLLAATVFAGFSLADIRDAGVSIVTVGARPRRGAARRRRTGAAGLGRARRLRLHERAAGRQRGARPCAMRPGGRPRAAARPRRQRDERRHLRHHRRCSRSACARG